MTSNKPIAFNYNDYLRAEREIKVLRRAVEEQQKQITKQVSTIVRLRKEIEELKLKGATVTDVIDTIKTKMCERCTQLEKCGIAVENGDDYECPMDKL